MPRYIDADKLKQHYSWWDGTGDYEDHKAKELFDDIIDLQPTADVVEVVRCKDCKWFNPINNDDHGICGDRAVYDDDFCSDGERADI